MSNQYARELLEDGLSAGEVAYYGVVEYEEAPNVAIQRVLREWPDPDTRPDARSVKEELDSLMQQQGIGPEGEPGHGSGEVTSDESSLVHDAFHAVKQARRDDKAQQLLIESGYSPHDAQLAIYAIRSRIRRSKWRRIGFHVVEVVLAAIVLGFVAFAVQESGYFYWWIALAGACALLHGLALLIWTPFTGITRFERPEDLFADEKFSEQFE